MATATPISVPALDAAAELAVADAFVSLASGARGLTEDDVAARLQQFGANALRSHGASFGAVFRRQLRNPLLILLVSTAAVSAFVGDTTDAVVIFVIITLSVGLGVIDEFRSELAVQALHDRIRHRCDVVRSGNVVRVDVTDLVPGDVVILRVGDVIPADLRIVESVGLACDESVVTGESLPVDKDADARSPSAACALMGTVVREGTGRGLVVGVGERTAFGRIAAGLGERHPETAFQQGLRSFSMFLVRVAAVLTIGIFVINLALERPFIEALLFSLAIAIGITPQLLPAIVTLSLSSGTRRLAQHKVLVKRLVTIEDLGNVTTLFTDKTGTLTDGRVAFDRALDASGAEDRKLLVWGLVANDAVHVEGSVAGNPLDCACWAEASPEEAARAAGFRRVAALPFDHERRMTSVLVERNDRRTLVVKGEPETILARAGLPADGARRTLDTLFREGARVVAVATRPAAIGETAVGAASEHDLHLEGFLVFRDPPKPDARASLAELASLGVEVKIITGDAAEVAMRVCDDVGLAVTGVATGAQIETLDDDGLAALITRTTVFARVGPEQKARLVRVQRLAGRDTAFMGDGVNDALALHAADVGISVDEGVDVAKDAADVILLDKDLGVLVAGVTEGRRIFANTVKYVLMATSSNFGNMFSAAVASTFLPFLPMLPSQILLNNLLYDTSQLTIPTDRVDAEQLARPSQWDLRAIRRFMTVFGPLSSIFDFLTFGILLLVLHAGASEFRSGWFVESLATQTLVVFVIRTVRVPFWKSPPSRPLLVATLTVPLVGAILPFTPLANTLGFVVLPARFMMVLVVLVVVYLTLAQLARAWFNRIRPRPPVPRAARLATPIPVRARRVHRRASRFSRRRKPSQQPNRGVLPRPPAVPDAAGPR